MDDLSMIKEYWKNDAKYQKVRVLLDICEHYGVYYRQAPLQSIICWMNLAYQINNKFLFSVLIARQLTL